MMSRLCQSINYNLYREWLKNLPVLFFIVYGSIMILISNAIASTGPSINQKAINAVINGEIREANAAWWGFYETDSTNAIQSAISSRAKKIVVPNMGRPWIVETILLESDKEIVFERGVIISAKSGAFRKKTDAMFKAINKSNVILKGYGAEFIMQKKDYTQPPYEKGEWRHCISIEGSQNVKIYGLRLANSGGDGIYIGRGIGKEVLSVSENIHIKDVTCDGNYRQGISIVSSANLLIENCIFQGTAGTPPQSGVDFEPDHPDEILLNCRVKRCIFRDNFGVGVLIHLLNLNGNSKNISIIIEECFVYGNKQGAISISGKNRNGPGGPKGSILVMNCKIEGLVRQHNTELLDIRFQ